MVISSILEMVLTMSNVMPPLGLSVLRELIKKNNWRKKGERLNVDPVPLVKYLSFFLQSYETIKYVYFVFLQRFKAAII